MFFYTDCDGLVVPGEVFSLSGAAIQTIPKIAKGTDSRFGVGFRFGEHADFQTIIELGPQQFTKPLGKQWTVFWNLKLMSNTFLSKFHLLLAQKGAKDDSKESDTNKRVG